MATLNAKLTLSSTDLHSGTFTLTADVAAGVAVPFEGISRVAAEASSGSATSIKPSGSANQYLYVKHTGFQSDGTTATTHQLSLEFGGADSARLDANEWAFIPVKSSVVVGVKSASTHTIMTEYAWFTAS
tara:strand:- start:172 stop:561 length:390 start_codon:yes stop_codon:yes gene_type:complete